MQLLNNITNRKSLVFLFCVLAVTIAWFINKLSKEYPYQLSYPVCVYSSTAKTPLNCAENLLKVSVRASGFYIMNHHASPLQLDIDIKRMRLKQEQTEYSIPISAIQGSIIDAISNSGVKVEHIITESLLFEKN